MFPPSPIVFLQNKYILCNESMHSNNELLALSYFPFLISILNTKIGSTKRNNVKCLMMVGHTPTFLPIWLKWIQRMSFHKFCKYKKLSIWQPSRNFRGQIDKWDVYFLCCAVMSSSLNMTLRSLWKWYIIYIFQK